jgi:MSHA biogenesis protein MshP
LWDDLPPALQQHICKHGEEVRLANQTREAGFTIVQAIFVLVVLGMLGAYMVTMSTVQQATSTQALMQARAYQAARSGLEWGIATVNNAAEAASDNGSDSEEIIQAANDACSSFNTGENIDDMVGLAGETLVTCSLLGNPKEADSTYCIYNIKSKAAYPNIGAIENPDFVSRRLEVTMMVTVDE